MVCLPGGPSVHQNIGNSALPVVDGKVWLKDLDLYVINLTCFLSNIIKYCLILAFIHCIIDIQTSSVTTRPEN